MWKWVFVINPHKNHHPTWAFYVIYLNTKWLREKDERIFSSQEEALTILLKIFVCLFTIIVVHYQTKAQQKYEYVSSTCTEEINYYD